MQGWRRELRVSASPNISALLCTLLVACSSFTATSTPSHLHTTPPTSYEEGGGISVGVGERDRGVVLQDHQSKE